MKRYLLQQTYMRIFILFTIILVVAVVPFSYFLANQFGYYAYKEIVKSNNDKLEQTVDNTEFILHRIKASGLVMYKDQNIRNWLDAEQVDKILDSNAVNELTNYLVTEPFISKVYLINLRNRQIIDSQTGIRDLTEFADLDLLKAIEQNDQSYLTFTDHDTGNVTFPTLIVPTDPAKNKYNGYLIALLDRKTVETYLLQRNEQIGIKVIVLDSNGKLLMGEEQSQILNVLAPHMNQANMENEFQVKTNEGDSLSVSFLRMHSQNWGFYYITNLNEWKSTIASFKEKILISTVVLLAILLFAFFLGLRRTYRPFTKLAANIREQMKRNSLHVPDQAEYEVLKKGIEFLSDTLEDMSTSMKSNRELIKGKYLREWILIGKLNESIQQFMEKETTLFQYPQLHLIVIRIDYYKHFCDHYSFSSRGLIKYAMANIAVEILSLKGWSTEVIDFDGDHILCLLGSNETNQIQINQTLEEVGEKIHYWLKISTVTAISEAHKFSDEIRNVYDHIYDLTMLKFISGKEKVYMETDFEEYSGIAQSFASDTVMEDLIHSLRLGRLETAIILLEKLFEPMYNLSYSECKYQLTTILYNIIKAFSQFTIKSFENISESLEIFSTLDEVKHWLKMQITAIFEQLDTPVQINKKEEMVKEIKEYVEKYIQDSQLNIEKIADHFTLSVSYLRQIFREVNEITLSDFIQMERLSSVKQMIVTTNWSISDIAERSGYHSKSHFFTVFKKHTGMTPTEYREIHLNKS